MIVALESPAAPVECRAKTLSEWEAWAIWAQQVRPWSVTDTKRMRPEGPRNARAWECGCRDALRWRPPAARCSARSPAFCCRPLQLLPVPCPPTGSLGAGDNPARQEMLPFLPSSPSSFPFPDILSHCCRPGSLVACASSEALLTAGGGRAGGSGRP